MIPPTPPTDAEQQEKYHTAMEYFQKAYELQMSGELEAAVINYKKSLEIWPTAEAYTFLGWTYSFQGKLEEAIAECKKAIATDPDFGNPYNDIGAYLIDLNRLDEAIPWLEKAIHAKRYEARCYPHYNLGRIWQQKGEFGKAIQCYRSSLKENPDYTLAQETLARLWGKMN